MAQDEKKQPKKPGPEAERLKIEGDPLAAFDKLVRHKPEPDAEGEQEPVKK